MSIVPVASGTYDGVSPSPEPMTLWESLRQADIDDGAASVKTVWESAGLGELRRRNGLLGQENEVLRRAAAYPLQSNVQSRSLDGVRAMPGGGDAWFGGMVVQRRS